MKRVIVIAALMVMSSLAFGQERLKLPPLIIIGTRVQDTTNGLPVVELNVRADGSLIITGPPPPPVPAYREKIRTFAQPAEPADKPCYDT